MTNKLTLTEQEELFAKDCKLINLKYEYNGYTGDEKWVSRPGCSVVKWTGGFVGRSRTRMSGGRGE